MFANADGDDRPILFFTTSSEPADKVVRYLQLFGFIDESRLDTLIRDGSVDAGRAGGRRAGVTAD